MSKLRNSAGERQGNSGLAQYFTPYRVAEFMWQAAQLYADSAPGSAVRVIDPAAGKGVFLQAVLAWGELSSRQIYGIEIDPELTCARADEIGECCFFCGDGLLEEFPGVEPESFDLVVGNPPFGRLGKILPQTVKSAKWRHFEIWQTGKRSGARELRNFPIELLFIERALQLVKSGGVIAYIMPEGFLTNTRLQKVRDWVYKRAQVLGVVSLPEKVFRGPRLNAKVAAVFLRRRRGRRTNDTALLVHCPADSRFCLERYLQETFERIRRQKGSHRRRIGGDCPVPERKLEGERWDAGFWRGRQQVSRLNRRFPFVPLGDFILHLTYGPIVTGGHPQHVADGIRIIRQGDFTETGLCAEEELCVARGSAYDLPRSRVRQRDLLMPRSGAGALGRNRLAVYMDEEPANIGCFVDLVRLEKINPFYVWFFFKTQPGWRQIQALINGVGTPNINFSEIRSLRIFAIPVSEQVHIERRYRQEVWSLHCRRSESEVAHREGKRRFNEIVRDLEMFLEGERRTTGVCPNS